MKNKMINYALVLSFLTGCQPSGQTGGFLDSAQMSGLTGGGKGSSANSKFSEDEALRNIINNSSLPLKSKELLAQAAEKDLRYSGSSDIESLKRTQNAFYAEQQRIASNTQILNASKTGLSFLITATSLGATATGVGAPAAVAIEIANTTITKSLEYGISELETRSRTEATKLLASKLKNVSAKELKAFDALKKLSPDQALKETEKMVNNWFPESKLNDIPAELRAEARSVTTHWVARTALAKLAEFKSGQQIINNTIVGDIESTQKQLVSLGSTLKTFAGNTKENIQALANSQKEIAKGLEEVSETVNKHANDLASVADDVKFLNDFAFERMTAKEQIARMEHDLQKKGQMTVENAKKISLLKAKATFEENYKTYFNGAQDLVKIAKAFKVDAKIVNDISNGLQTINAVATGVQLVMAGGTGGYIAGAAAIAGLMGGGGDDGSAARHQEIIMRLDKVLENQEKMTELIKKTFEIQVEMLTKLSEQIRQSTEVLVTKIDDVHNDVLWNRVILSSINFKALASCNMAAKTLNASTFHDAISQLNFRDHLTACSLEYDRVFKLKDFAAHFSSAAYKTPKNGTVLSADEKNFNEALAFLRSKFNGSYAPSESLRNPSQNAYGILQKMSYLNSIGKAQSEAEVDENLNAFQHRLFAPGVTKNVQKMISLYPYIALWNARYGNSTEEVLNIRNFKPNAGTSDIETLEAALDLVNFSIQQETLMAGDILLPMLYEKFVDVQTPGQINSEGKEQLCDGNNAPRCMIASNDMLRTNFVIFGLYNEFYQNKSSLSAYRQALRIPNDVLGLKRILRNNWNISWSAEGKYVVNVAGKASELPTFETIAEGKMKMSGALAMLLRTREDLINLKAESTMNGALAADQKNIIHSLFIKK